MEVVYEAMSSNDLLKLLQDRGLDTTGKKAQVVATLRDFDQWNNEKLNSSNDPDGSRRKARAAWKHKQDLLDIDREIETAKAKALDGPVAVRYCTEILKLRSS